VERKTRIMVFAAKGSTTLFRTSWEWRVLSSRDERNGQQKGWDSNSQDGTEPRRGVQRDTIVPAREGAHDGGKRPDVN